MAIKVEDWSLIGRLRDTMYKFISTKGVMMIAVFVAVWMGKIGEVEGLAFITLTLGIREYGKVKGVETFQKFMPGTAKPE